MKNCGAAIILMAILLNSCEQSATFDKPQPDNIKSSSFPEFLQGKYLAAASICGDLE
jgi:hypothetical protein